MIPRWILDRPTKCQKSVWNIVRNPFDHLVSRYEYIKAKENHHFYEERFLLTNWQNLKHILILVEWTEKGT